ncbi:nucleotide-binding universal stress UspA family protein [Kitasatospora sp. MAA4]|uniref:universal stress protein n=1 Tax=Kitasatospora sp. MAA4 TaxID=3035093 RepID=UPI00247429E2|nr:universal stress protein [Kitasatospora sp. MAA4]MDH6137580.1 nucleotide-binding universal stress UspA family protein [Kitasatospora sp. MAA4]
MYSGTQERQQRVVVGVSGSLGSLAALHRAVVEARRADAEVLAVLAWLPVGGEYGYRRSPCPPLLAVWRQAAEGRLAEALDEAFGGAPTGVRLSTVVIRGESGPALVQTADREDDLLVVGAGSGSRLARGLRRSVPAYCVKHADCPVLAVPRPALQRDLKALRRRSVRQLLTEPILSA